MPDSQKRGMKRKRGANLLNPLEVISARWVEHIIGDTTVTGPCYFFVP
jgi:hypothetical protein